MSDKHAIKVPLFEIQQMIKYAQSIRDIAPDTPAYYTESDGTMMIATPLGFAQREAEQILATLLMIDGLSYTEIEDDEN